MAVRAAGASPPRPAPTANPRRPQPAAAGNQQTQSRSRPDDRAAQDREKTINADLSTRQARIVVGIDGSPHSRLALQWSAHLAQMHGAGLEAVTAWDYPAIYGRAAVIADWNSG